jgi:hypothetical protein
MRRRPRAIWFLGLAVGCNPLSPLEGYSKTREDAPPFEEISKTCREQAAFRDAGDTNWTDWREFEACMNEHGWTRAPDEAGAS